MDKTIKLLAVCGSGTVTSSMVAGEVKDKLASEGITVNATESRPSEAQQQIENGNYDLVIFTSPLPAGDYKIPIMNATGLLTGMGEDEFWEELEDTVKKIK